MFFLTDLESAYKVNPEKGYTGNRPQRKGIFPISLLPLRLSTFSHKVLLSCFPGIRLAEITVQICIKLFFLKFVG